MRSKLEPRPLPTGEPPRAGGSRLEARRCTTLTCGTFLGTAGTGGASRSTGLLRAGEGARKVRSVMEPELECRRKPGRAWLSLPWEEMEALRTIRFVTVSPTGVGDVACVRSAAAAAAEDKAPLDSRSRMKAFVAAREADAEGGLFGACICALAVVL